MRDLENFENFFLGFGILGFGNFEIFFSFQPNFHVFPRIFPKNPTQGRLNHASVPITGSLYKLELGRVAQYQVPFINMMFDSMTLQNEGKSEGIWEILKKFFWDLGNFEKFFWDLGFPMKPLAGLENASSMHPRSFNLALD